MRSAECGIFEVFLFRIRHSAFCTGDWRRMGDSKDLELGKASGALRVLMVAPTPYFSDRGCHVQIYEVAHSQKSLGNDVRIVTYHLGRDLGDIPTSRTLRLPWYDKRDAGPSAHKFY